METLGFNSGYITEGQQFRFLKVKMANGEYPLLGRLQVLEHRRYSDHYESVWVDVPTVTE